MLDDGCLVFIHIPKTAGDTLNRILGRQYRKRPSPSRPWTGQLTGSERSTEQLARARSERMAKLIPKARLIYLVRNPVERIRSHYEHVVTLYNLEGPRRVSIREVAETVSESIEGTVIEYFQRCPGDHVVDRPISVEKAKRELGWEPTTSLKEGVAQYVEWFRTTSTQGSAPTTAGSPSKRQSKRDGAAASPISP